MLITSEKNLWDSVQDALENNKVRDSSHFFIAKIQKVAFEELQLNLELDSNVPVMERSPQVDLLYFAEKTFTEEQKKYLPDGIAQSKTGKVIGEFKNTEKADETGLKQSLGYHEFLAKREKLKGQEVETFLLSCQTPKSSVLEEFGYKEDPSYKGVFRSPVKPWNTVKIISLNELLLKPNNAMVMLFASKLEVRIKAFHFLRESDLYPKTKTFKNLLAFLWSTWSAVQKAFKNNPYYSYEEEQMTAEELVSQVNFQDFEKVFGKDYLHSMSTSERVDGISPEELVADLPPEEIMRIYPSNVRVAGLAPEERVAGLAPEERVAGLAPEERVAGLAIEDRLKGLNIEELEAFLKKNKES